MAHVSTITQSTADETYCEIPIDYFITKDQKRNKTSKLDDGEEFTKLRANITRSINERLNAMMLIQAQKIGLRVKDKKTEGMRLVQKYSNIGSIWESNDSTKTASQINISINSTFTNNIGYEYYIESKILNEFKLKYPQNCNIKDSITRMVVIRKCELAKVINKHAKIRTRRRF